MVTNVKSWKPGFSGLKAVEGLGFLPLFKKGYTGSISCRFGQNSRPSTALEDLAGFGLNLVVCLG